MEIRELVFNPATVEDAVYAANVLPLVTALNYVGADIALLKRKLEAEILRRLEVYDREAFENDWKIAEQLEKMILFELKKLDKEGKIADTKVVVLMLLYRMLGDSEIAVVKLSEGLIERLEEMGAVENKYGGEEE